MAGTWSTGSPTWVTTTCRCTSTRSRSGCGPKPTTTSPGATAAGTSTCAGSRRLYGRLIGIQSGRLEFAADLAHNLDQADAVAESIKNTIDKFIDANGITAPSEARYAPVWRPEREARQLDLAQAGIHSVIWSIGYRSDYRWIDVPVFDGRGYPSHQRGVTTAGGLYFLGLPWLDTWGSGRFSGVAQDAEYLAGRIFARIESRADVVESRERALNELALGS